MSSYYVRRTSKQNPVGYSYVGPMSLTRAENEMAAWESVGETVELVGASTLTRAMVRRWEKVCKADDARDIVTFRGEQMTMARYRIDFEEAA